MANKKLRHALLDFFELLVIALGIIAFSWFFLAEPLEVTGDSMLPSLRNEEQIIAEKLSSSFSEIERGEIVVFYSPKGSPNGDERLLIKRVIGLPSDSVSINNGKVFVNGTEIKEGYLAEGTDTKAKSSDKNQQLIKAGADQYVLLGDNRDNSTDSRNFGAINKDLIVGKAFLVYSPTDSIRFIHFSLREIF